MGRSDAALQRRDYAAARVHLEFGLGLMFRPRVDREGPMGLSLVTSLTLQFVRVLDAQGALAEAKEPIRRALEVYEAANKVAPIRGKHLTDWKQWATGISSKLARAPKASSKP